MEKIYSKVEPNKLLHIIHRLEDFDTMEEGRIDIIEPDNFLQCAALKLPAGKTFKPHKHILVPIKDTHKYSQESWVIRSGSVRCTFYDIDDTIICEPILKAGDASFTIGMAGHTYSILEDNTFVWEFKSGKYEGVELDKVFI